MFEGNRVFLPADAPWLADFVDELAAFPNGVHDDMVDSTRRRSITCANHRPTEDSR